jgi:hypothetical protein
MSMMEMHRLKCPKCGTEQDVTVCDSINVTADPSLREGLLAGAINVLSCTSCQHKAMIQTPLLYHDMKREFCVQYFPPQAIDNAGFIERFDPDGQPKLDGVSPSFARTYLARPHVVFDLNEMITYVLFREKLKP